MVVDARDLGNGEAVAGTPAEGIAITRRYHDEHFQEMKLYSDIKADVHLASISGGTDLCGCFVGGDPTRPVWAGCT